MQIILHCREQLPAELGGSPAQLSPWLWQSAGRVPMKTNAKVVLGQVLFCVGNDTHLLQATLVQGKYFTLLSASVIQAYNIFDALHTSQNNTVSRQQ